MATSTQQLEIPDVFRCGITGDLMSDPGNDDERTRRRRQTSIQLLLGCSEASNLARSRLLVPNV